MVSCVCVSSWKIRWGASGAVGGEHQHTPRDLACFVAKQRGAPRQLDVCRNAKQAARRPLGCSATKAEFCDDRSIAFDVVVDEVVEQSTALADQLEEPTTAVVVLLVQLEMFGEVTDSLTEQRHLNFSGAGIGVVMAMVFHRRCFVLHDVLEIQS